jgi:hypothetical protein
MRRWFSETIHSDDPLVEAGNMIALVVAGNQPFYPLYLWMIIGDEAWRSWNVIAAIPFFLAVPFVARRSSVAGRALLPVVGIVNTIASIWLLGAEAGLAFFFVPCAAIAAILFRARERLVMLAIVGFAMLAWWLSAGWARGVFSTADYASIQRLNAMSAIALCGFLGIVLAGALARVETGQRH